MESVQGVGFRPFVAGLANKLKISGIVKNDGGIVIINVTGTNDLIDIFLRRLKNDCPSGSKISEVIVLKAPFTVYEDFKIVNSSYASNETPLIPVDLPVCEDCKNELYDPSNRRYLNPFISCVSCGPRYSIICELPYDRDRTTMEEFQMCENCEEEYNSFGRRGYAQTISCHDCGPYLILKTKDSCVYKTKAFIESSNMLNNGGILAIKGVGGYQFVCSPFEKDSVENLRTLKRRDKKPFAIMFSSIEEIKRYCKPNKEEIDLLLSEHNPIVLLLYTGSNIDENVFGESRFLGAFLPCTPLQQLLVDKCGPLIMTSGNLSDEPIIKDDETALSIDSKYLSGVLYNTREIYVQLDDSVAKITEGKTQIIRRSRGYIPEPITFKNIKAVDDIIACGADLKSTFCLLKNDKAYMSQYFGDMKYLSVQTVFKQNIQHMESIFNIHPKYVACDMHPEYYSTKTAKQMGLKLIPVQHHHAHIASVMAEHNVTKKVIGVALDGTGYGDDGAIWGGEFLICNEDKYIRAAHLSYVKMSGGDNASKDASLCAACYLYSSRNADFINYKHFDIIKSALDNNVLTHLTSSMGRLFDAVCAILGIKDYNSYESECAIALENFAFTAQEKGLFYELNFVIEDIDGVLLINQQKLISDIVFALKNSINIGAIALGFHEAIANMILNVCNSLRVKYNTNTVALSGGVFANSILLSRTLKLLNENGFEVYINEAVPTNDSGIALGQCYLANLIINAKEE